MRPKEVWEKPANGGDGKRRRTASSSKQRTDSASGSATNPTPGDTALYSEASSPANGGGQTDATEAEPQLPVMNHRRASSDQGMSPQSKGRAVNEMSAVAALQRAIQSSPHKFMGTNQMPIEVENLTPQPTRRILFPSPTQAQGAASKRNSSAGSARREVKRNTSECDPPEVNAQADKENCPPQVPEHENYEHLFNEDPILNARSRTLTPCSLKRTTTFKTPLRSPGRLPPTAGDFFSSAAKAMLRPPTTPKRTPTKESQPLGELTPFTAHLNQLLSEANDGSPRSQSFDFPSLPSLRNTPGRATRAIDFDFSQFDSQDLVSTDVSMPSSPPAWFGVCEDHVDNGDGSLLGEHQLSVPASTPGVDEAQVIECKEPEASGYSTSEG